MARQEYLTFELDRASKALDQLALKKALAMSTAMKTAIAKGTATDAEPTKLLTSALDTMAKANVRPPRPASAPNER